MYIEKKPNSWLLSTEVKECSSFAKNVCHMLPASVGRHRPGCCCCCCFQYMTFEPELGKLAHATQISYSTYLSGNALHKFNTLRKFNALRKGNTYHANFVLHNTPHTVALSYLQGERTPELHRLSWQCLDNTLKLEIGMLNPHTCVGTHSTKLTHTVQTS